MQDLVLGALNSTAATFLVATALALFSIWLTAIYQRRNRQVSKLSYMIGDAAVISPNPHDDGRLEIRYDDQIVPRVTSTSFGLFNAGTSTIHGRDIVDADPLRLEFDGEAQILRASVENSTRAVLGAAVDEVGHRAVQIRFDYLDRGDGFRLQVIHTGAPGELRPHGSIRGLPDGLVELGDRKSAEKQMKIMVGVMIALTGIVLLTMAGIMAAIAYQGSTGSRLAVLGMCAVFAFSVFSGWRSSDDGPPKIKGVPTEITEDPVLMRHTHQPTVILDPYGGIDRRIGGQPRSL